MLLKYFLPPYTKDNIGAQYKDLCKKLHPDKPGGNGAKFIAMKNEYDTIIKVLNTPKPTRAKHTRTKKNNTFARTVVINYNFDGNTLEEIKKILKTFIR